MEQLEEVQKALMQFLKICGADQETAVGIVLILDKYPEATENYLLWLDEFNSEKRALSFEEMNKAIEMAEEFLPSETSPQER